VVKPRIEKSPTDAGIRVRYHGHRMRETCMISEGQSQAHKSHRKTLREGLEEEREGGRNVE
jgi:hypothetical protein